jgi:hypothetical protein
MIGLGYIQDVFMNLGPYAAGAATVVVPAYVPLPGVVGQTLALVPPAVWAGGAGYMVATPGEDQACAALKGVAGGVGAAFILSRIL